MKVAACGFLYFFRLCAFSLSLSLSSSSLKGGRGWNDRLSRDHLLLSV